MKNQKTIIAGLMVMAAMLSVSVTYSTAFAQESDVAVEAIEKPIHLRTVLVGTGAVVAEDDHGYRSHFRMGIVADPSVTDVASDVNYEVKRGKFIVGKYDDRRIYSVMPDTWTVTVSADKTVFDANGQVENRAGEVFDVMISGEKISDLQRGNLYYVSGFASNEDGEMYDLFYISALFDKNPTVRPLPVE
jgi:hypothetical protein